MSASRLQGLVLAGGEGTRLGSLGTPKPLVSVADEALIVHAVRALDGVGCRPIHCLVREPFATAAAAVVRAYNADVVVEPCLTPSSLHTLGLGLQRGPGPWMVTMVDTIMPDRAWAAFARAASRALARSADVVLGITSFVDDESPLRVRVGVDGRAMAIGPRAEQSPWVTAGVYAFSPRVAERVPEALAQGIARLRGFLGWALGTDLCIFTVELPMTVDVDRPSDLAVASSMLEGSDGQGTRQGR